MISIKHASRTVEKEQKKTSVSLTWQGPKFELEEYLATLTLNDWYDGLGQFTNSRLTQDAGPIWNLELSYVVNYADDGSIANKEDEVSGPNTQQLQARTLSRPIETHPNYRTCWNHFLIGKCFLPKGETTWVDYTKTVPPWWSTATDPFLDPLGDGFAYRWVKSLGEMPMPTDTERWALVKGATVNPAVVCKPQKPGVETYDMSFYVITEVGEHKNKTKAGWATNALINTVIQHPLLGDFGLTPTGYNWKVDSIDVAYDGKRWKASRTYTRSGDANGWDPQLYTYNYTP